MINKSQVNQDLTNIRSLNLVVGKANDSPKENKSAYAQGELEGSVRLLAWLNEMRDCSCCDAEHKKDDVTTSTMTSLIQGRNPFQTSL